MQPGRTWVLVAAVLAGCAVSVQAPTGASKGAPRAATTKARVSAAPAKAASPSAVPAAASASPAAPSTAPTAAPTTPPGVGSGLAIAFPTKLLPPLPASLAAAGAGGLVGPDGASLIGPDGASLIGMDGGSLIGMDGASYALAQATTAPTAAPTCAPPAVPIQPGKLIAHELSSYLRLARQVEGILADAAKMGLVPGVPETVEGASMSPPGGPLTFLVERRGTDGGILRVGNGAAVTPDNQQLTLAFTSDQAGEVVYDVEMMGLKVGMHMTFDLEKGDSTGDFVTGGGLPGFPSLTSRKQVALTRLAPAGPGAAELRLRSASANLTGMPCMDYWNMLAVSYLPDGRAAMQYAESNVKGQAPQYMGIGGKRAPVPGPDTGFFIDKDGMYIAGDTVVAEIGPAMPTADQVPLAPPPDPDPKDPTADAAFTMLP